MSFRYLSALLLCAAAPALAVAPEAMPISLRWKALSVEDGHTVAARTLRNIGDAPLSLAGWSIAFSSISAPETAGADGGAKVENIAGPLFRVRPTAPDRMLAPGETLVLTLNHEGRVDIPDKAPVAPYVVRDSAPDVGAPIADYAAEPLASALPPPPPAARRAAKEDLPPVFPTPRVFSPLPGVLAIENYPVDAPASLASEADFARRLFAGTPASSGRRIRLSIGAVAGMDSPEAYRLQIDPGSGIAITGASAAGVFHGLQSLAQLSGVATGGVLPALDISDAPRFPVRRLMIDVARNFQSKETIISVIDLMARYKLNSLHLHLTDDEGWRIAVPALPELTETGARRAQDYGEGRALPPAYGSAPDGADRHGTGYYSAEDYIEILRHAAERHIEVVPEIEMPGHARAAVHAMIERERRLRASGAAHADAFRLADPDDASVYTSVQYYNDNVMDPGLPSTYRFIETVVDALADLHRRAGVPLQRLHIGGDELAQGAWEGSPASKRLLSSLHKHETADLWDYFYDHVISILEKRDIEPIGWEELGLRKIRAGRDMRQTVNGFFLKRRPTLQVWNNFGESEGLAYRLANAGYDILISPATQFYLDMAYRGDASEPGHDWAAHTDVADVYALDPLAMRGPTRLSAAGKAHIKGIEATLFAETIRDDWRVGYMLMPRLLAFAERGWAPVPEWTRKSGTERDAALARDWSIFATKAGTELLPALDREMPGLFYRLPPPNLTIENGRVIADPVLPGLVLRYTTDGSAPTALSPVVAGPIADKGVIGVAAFSTNGRAGRASRIENR